MKRYRKFMSGVKPSDTLNRRLKELKEPKKGPAPWAKYGAIAAAFILVFGGAALGMHWDARWSGRLDELFRQASYVPENVDAPQPDIAIVEPGDETGSVEKTVGSYEYHDPRFEGLGVVSFIMLPDIDYGNTGLSEAQTALDWDIPQGAFRRDMSREHIAYLLGGEDALSTHLDWDGYELSGWAAWYENGDFWGAYVMGHQGPLDHFEFAVTADQLPPTCIAYPHSVEQDICGITVTADGHDSVATPSGGVDASTRRVSFMRDGYGFRFDLTSTSRALAEERVSRLVRLVADDGTRYLEWITDTMEPVMTANADGTVTCTVCGETFPDRTHGDGSLSKHESETTICPTCGETFPVGDEKAHVHSFQGPASTGDYNPDDGAPAVSALPRDPNEESPRDRGENWCGTPDADPDDAMCSGYPAPHICEICGEAYPEGAAHSHEVCGLPLAPDTHVCEVCGQTLRVGMEHSHQQEHHSEHH